MDALELPLIELAALIENGYISPVEVASATLDRIASYDAEVNAFAFVAAESFMRQAQRAEEEIRRGGYRGPLHGIPVGIKDLFDTRGIPTAAGSQVRSGRVPSDDAAAVERLREAGMTMVGKTTTHEFAHGGVTPGTGNPWDPRRIPGGSSGGSAAAVGARMVHAALGTDTAGSVRIPAALCGAVGLKPTFGLVSRYGLTPLSWSLDHVGPITRHVADAAFVLEAIRGRDARDPATADAGERKSQGLRGDIRGLRVGIPENYFTERVQPTARAAAANAARWLQDAGATAVGVKVPAAELIGVVEWTVLTAEASAYQSQTLRRMPYLLGEDVRMLNEAGEAILATDYINALRLRTVIRAKFKELFAGIDLLLTPTISASAASRADPVIRWPDGFVEGASEAYTRFCIPANVTGLPALQVPAGFSDEGMPVGVQLIGAPFQEDLLFRAGAVIEASNPDRDRRPEITRWTAAEH